MNPEAPVITTDVFLLLVTELGRFF